MSRQMGKILRLRLRLAGNYVEDIRRHVWIHLFVGLGVVFFLMVGGGAFFHFLFRFLHYQEDFGDLLMDRLVGMVMMTFFSMLVFSNLIITLSTTYISREIEWFMALPVKHHLIFYVKMVESLVYSSWAFAILSLPLFLSYGSVRDAGWPFWLGMPPLILPFLAIPAGLGSILVVLLTAFLPAKKALKYSLLFVLLAMAGVLAVFRLTGIQETFRSLRMENFTQVMSLMNTGDNVFLPHSWFTRAMTALAKKDYAGYAYWFALLLANALMALEVAGWVAKKFYYRGWCLARGSLGGVTEKKGKRRGFFDWLESRLTFLKPPYRALIVKDAKTFWRDPAQWSQLIILFGLVFLYVAHLRSAFYNSSAFNIFVPRWQVILSYFNMGSTCFILSILTTRFVYPMLSLEGKQFWTVGLAPMERNRVVWQKYVLCWSVGVIICEGLMLFSSWVLQAPPLMTFLSCVTIFFMTFGLTSLSVGLGAAYPNFREDNPARIANGLGGTLNVVLSLLYIALIIALESWPAFLYFTGHWPRGGFGVWLLAGVITALVLVQIAAMVLPMKVGLSRWRRMEF